MRELSEDDRLVLLRLTEQVGQIAERLDRLDAKSGLPPAGPSGVPDDSAFRFESPKLAFTPRQDDGTSRLVRATRPKENNVPKWVPELVSWGAGPRAVQYLVLGAKARAALMGSYMVRMEDVVAVAQPVLRHRLMTTFTAQSDGIDSIAVTKRLVEELRKEG